MCYTVAHRVPRICLAAQLLSEPTQWEDRSRRRRLRPEGDDAHVDMRLALDAAELGVNIDSLGSGLGPLPVTWG